MQPEVQNILAEEVRYALEFARGNPIRFPGDPVQIDRVVDLALRNPGWSVPQIIEQYERQWGRRPRIRVYSELRRYRLARADGREACGREIMRQARNLDILLAATDPARAADAYRTLQAWLRDRTHNDAPMVARVLMMRLAARLAESPLSAEREIGRTLAEELELTLPLLSLKALRKIVYGVAEHHGLRERSLLSDKVEELLSSVEDATGGESATDEHDAEALQAENADLRAALFGLKQELTDLYTQLREQKEITRVEALVNLLATMNAQANRRLLDNMAQSSLVVNTLLRRGWQPEPAEVEGVVYSLKMFMDYLARIGVVPMREIGSREAVTLADLAQLSYAGSEFSSHEERKWVEFRTPGWAYEGHIITKPQAVEVKEAVPGPQ